MRLHHRRLHALLCAFTSLAAPRSSLTCLHQLWRGMQRSLSDKLITRLMRLTIETGSLTASVATLDLVLFLTFQHNNLHMAP